VACETICTFLRFKKTWLFTFFELLHTFSRTLLATHTKKTNVGQLLQTRPIGIHYK